MNFLADLGPLPGAHLVKSGVADLEAGHESAEALLVSIGAPRLRSACDPPASTSSSFPTTLKGGAGSSIEPDPYRFPAVDPDSFRRAVDDLFAS